MTSGQGLVFSEQFLNELGLEGRRIPFAHSGHEPTLADAVLLSKFRGPSYNLYYNGSLLILQPINITFS